MDDSPPDVAGPATAGPVAGAGSVLLSQTFTAATVTALRHTVAATVAAAGLSGDDSDGFVLAVHELVTNAVRHGGGSGRLDLFRQDDVLVCHVTDHGAAAEGLPVALPASNVPGGRGLWLAHQLTGALTLSRRPDGVTASVTVCLTPQTARVAGRAGPAAAGERADGSATEGGQR